MLLLTLGLAASPLLTPVLADGEPAEVVSEALFAKLEAGPDDEDLETALAALEWDFGHPGILEATARIAGELEENDLAWWYGALASEAADAAGDDARRDALDEFLSTVTPEGADPNGVFEEYAKDLFKLAQDCKTKKLYANSADVLMRCRGTRFERRAENLMASLFKKKDAIDSIFRSGIDLPEKPTTKKDPKWIAKYDAEHADWTDVEDIDGRGYTIQTNMGWEMGNTFVQTMEQMGEFYKDLFRIRKKVKPCTIRIYATREDMAQNEGEFEQGVLGWFSPSQNMVVTFDPRSRDRPLSGLWETLFHEAAHQYTRAVSSRIIPGWYSEGTACYFEGAKLLPSGAVLTNQIPEGRLRSLVMLLDEERPRASLKGCISYYQPGSFEGHFYPFAWGLTYYFFNYENEKSERIYIPIFREYQKLYTKEKQHDPVERFIDFFVTKAKVPGVDDFAEFDLHWQAWIRDLHDVYFGDESKADVLYERALVQQKNKKPEYAIESLRWAVDKRPDDIKLRMAFGEALADADQYDGATYAYRRAMELARTYPGDSIAGLDATPDDVVADCLQAISKISKNVGGGLEKSDAELVAGARATAEAFVEAGYPRSALHVVRTASKVLGGHRELDELQARLIEENDVDVTRVRRLRVGEDLEMWIASDGCAARDDNQLHLEPTDEIERVSASYREAPEGAFRYELRATFERVDEDCGLALTIGENPEGEQILMMLPGVGATLVLGFGEEGLERNGVIPGCPEFAEGTTYHIVVDVDGANVTLTVDDEELGSVELDSAGASKGRVGVSVQDASVVFADFALTY